MATAVKAPDHTAEIAKLQKQIRLERELRDQDSRVAAVTAQNLASELETLKTAQQNAEKAYKDSRVRIESLSQAALGADAKHAADLVRLEATIASLRAELEEAKAKPADVPTRWAEPVVPLHLVEPEPEEKPKPSWKFWQH